MLTPEERRVIVEKGTEAPFTGEYVNTTNTGVYVCKQCGRVAKSAEYLCDPDAL